jgi:hypothetical protein
VKNHLKALGITAGVLGLLAGAMAFPEAAIAASGIILGVMLLGLLYMSVYLLVTYP